LILAVNCSIRTIDDKVLLSKKTSQPETSNMGIILLPKNPVPPVISTLCFDIGVTIQFLFVERM